MAASIACVLAILYRAHLGGFGMWVGCAGIATASVLGVCAHVAADRLSFNRYLIPALAGAVSSSSFLMILYLIRLTWEEAITIGGPITVLIFGCTWLFPLSLLRDQRLYALLDENGIYRAIIETLPDSLNAKDLQSRFIAANPATARLMGVGSAKELIGKSDEDFYPAAIASEFRGEEAAVLAGRTVGPIDQVVEFPDGSRRWLTSMKTPLRDDAGNVKGIITHNRDVTERKRLEAELSRTEGYLQEALANMADGLVLYDFDGVIRFCNQQYRDLFPKTADLRVVGGRFSDIIRAAVERGEEAPKSDIEAWVDQRIQALRQSGDRLIHLYDGRIIEARSRPLAGSDTLVVFNDVTSRQQFETELLRRATHLIEVARRLRGAIRTGDVVARLGGDEFAFLLSGPDVCSGTTSLAARVLTSLQQPFRTDGIELCPGGSLGIATFPRDTLDPEKLLTVADQALYRVKRSGRGTWASASEQAPGSQVGTSPRAAA